MHLVYREKCWTNNFVFLGVLVLNTTLRTAAHDRSIGSPSELILYILLDGPVVSTLFEVTDTGHMHSYISFVVFRRPYDLLKFQMILKTT